MSRFRQVLGFILANWYKFVILGLVITMIVMVSIHVRCFMALQKYGNPSQDNL